MAIKGIDQKKCVVCKSCMNTCPVDVIRVENGRMIVKYPDDCGCCYACYYECPTDAIIMTPEAVQYATRSW